MRYGLYLRKGSVYIPTKGKVGRKDGPGLYLDIEPVEVVTAGEKEGLRRALERTIARGNPLIPHPSSWDEEPVLLKYAGVKSWRTFEKGTSSLIFEVADSGHEIVPQRKNPGGGGWVDDDDQTERFPAGTAVEVVIDRVIEIVGQSASKDRTKKNRTDSGSGNPAVGFGYKMAWLALEGDQGDQLVRALDLRDLGRAEWAAGVERAYETSDSGYGRFLFITPVVAGWTLCAGTGLFLHTDRRPPDFHSLVADLSSRLNTTVQYFATHRVIELQAWACARQGRLARAFCYLGESGETLVDVGLQTPEEAALDISEFPDEDDVLALAGKWSVNPSTLDGVSLPSGPRLAEFEMAPRFYGPIE